MTEMEEAYLAHREFSLSPSEQAQYDLDLEESFVNREAAIEARSQAAVVTAPADDGGLIEGILGVGKQFGIGAAEEVHTQLKNLSDLSDFLQENTAFGQLPIFDLPEIQVPKDPEFKKEQPEGIAESLARGAGGFAALFVPASKLLGAATSTAGVIAKGAGAGFVADFATDPNAGNLSDLIDSFVPELQNPVVDFLKSKPGDTQIEKRLKNAAEGLGLGAIIDGFMPVLRAIRGSQSLKKAVKEGR